MGRSCDSRRTLSDVRVAVTGSHGLIGSALVERLSGLGHDVVRLVRGVAGPDDISWDPPSRSPRSVGPDRRRRRRQPRRRRDRRQAVDGRLQAADQGEPDASDDAAVGGDRRGRGRTAACCCPARASTSTAIAATRSSTSGRHRATGSCAEVCRGVGGQHGGRRGGRRAGRVPAIRDRALAGRRGAGARCCRCSSSVSVAGSAQAGSG